MSLQKVIRIPLAFILTTFSSCQVIGTSTESLTYSRLRLLEELTEASMKKGFAIQQIETPNDVVEFALKNKIFTKSLIEAMDPREDVWGNDIRIIRNEKAGILELKFVSAGKNGVYEEGRGDDLVLTMSVELK